LLTAKGESWRCIKVKVSKGFVVGLMALILANAFTCAFALANTAPHDIHGPGYGFYRVSGEYWEGPVWAHYDENGGNWDPQGIWEVGVEGLPSWQWYTMGFVEFEHFSGPVMMAKGTFELDDEWPLQGLQFTYVANLKTMKWILIGPGFHFKGDIEVVNAYD